MLTTTDVLNRVLSPETYQRLQAAAETQHINIEDLLRAAVETYLDDFEDDDIEDTPDEEILEAFREGWRDMKAGRVISARQMLEEVRHELEEERRVGADDD